MVSVRFLIGVAAATLLATTAHAADMMPPPPPMAYQPPPMVTPCCAASGWYLRGDVGVGIQTFGDFPHTQTNSAFVWPASWAIVQKDVQDTAIFGGGIGYEWNNWFRTDFTAEYRTKAMFKATGRFTEFCGGALCFDVTEGNVASAVFMANAYVDLGTWWCITPYVGAGLGGAYSRITGVQDLGIIGSNGSVGFGLTQNDANNWNFAWNAQAGLSYNVTNNFKVDLSARYLHLGSPETAIVNCQNTASCPGAFYNLNNFNSWDFRVGLRWMLQPDVVPVMAPPPLMSRG